MRLVAPLLLVLSLLVAGCGGSDEDSGPLSLEQALDGERDGEVTVEGFYVEAEGEARLCSALLESFPPQCGRPALRLEGMVAVDDSQQASGVRWSDHEVAVRGELRDGVLVVDEASEPAR